MRVTSYQISVSKPNPLGLRGGHIRDGCICSKGVADAYNMCFTASSRLDYRLGTRLSIRGDNSANETIRR